MVSSSGIRMARAGLQEADHAVVGEMIRRLRNAASRQIGRGGARHLGQQGHAAGDHGAVGQVAEPQHAVDALAHQVDQPVAFGQLDLQVGIGRQEVGQARQHEPPRQGPLDIDPQQAAGRTLAERAFGLLQVVQQAQAALVIGLAVQGGADLAGGALE
jgi:hypothetical protein